MSFSRALVLLVLVLAGRAGYSQKIVPGYVVTAGQDSLRGAIVIHDETAQQKQVDFITAQGNQRQRLDAYQLSAYGYTTEKDTVRYLAVSMNLGRSGGKVEHLFLRQLVAGPAELFRYHYSREYYARPDRTGTEVSREVSRTSPTTSTSSTSYSVSASPLATFRSTLVPAGALAFPPLSATSARGGTGVSLLLRRRGQPHFVETTWWDFPTDAVAYFADCPALAPDLQAKHYRAKNLAQLVRRYNACPSPGH